MRVLTLVLLVMAALSGGDRALAQGSKAFEVCAKTALQQAMLVRSVVAQSDWRNRSGAVIGTKVDLDVNALGKKKKVSCYYTASSQSAVIREYTEGAVGGGSGNGSTPQMQREAQRACQRAGQQQGLMIDTVAAQRDIFNRKGQLAGREVILDVFQSGKARKLVCEYEFLTKQTALELRRP